MTSLFTQTLNKLVELSPPVIYTDRLELYVDALRSRFGFSEVPIIIATDQDKVDEKEHIDNQLLKRLNLDITQLTGYGSLLPSEPVSSNTAPYNIERMTTKLSIKEERNDYKGTVCIILRRLNYTETRLSIYCLK